MELQAQVMQQREKIKEFDKKQESKKVKSFDVSQVSIAVSLSLVVFLEGQSQLYPDVTVALMLMCFLVLIG